MPRSRRFGYHEWFHVTVIAGHATSMAFDLICIWLLLPRIL
jgi:hypothetical protein